MEKIKLRFTIKAYNGAEYIKNILTRTYNENTTFNKILKELYQQYSQHKFLEEELQPLGHNAYIIGLNLLDINYNFVELEPEHTMYDYNNVPIKNLEKKFNITRKRFEIWLDPEIGGEVGRCKGIHFFFHTNEKDIHHHPHIHCKCGAEEFRVDLRTVKILDKEFKNKKRTEIALDIIKKNQKELNKYWNDVVISGESVKFKMYFPYK